MEKNTKSEIMQIFQGVIESLLRMKQTKLKRVLFKKDKTENAIKKKIMTNEVNIFFEELSSQNKFRIPKSIPESLEKIIKILLPMNEQKLKLIYRVIKIITFINQPSELSSFISSNDNLNFTNSSDFLSIPQEIPEKMNLINNNIDRNCMNKNIHDFMSVKSFDSEKQNMQNMLKLEELKDYAKNYNISPNKMTKIKRKRNNKTHNSIMSIDKNSVRSNNNLNSDDQSSGLSFELKNSIIKDDCQFKSTDLKKNSCNLYSIDKCLIPIDNNKIEQKITSSNHSKDKGIKHWNEAKTQNLRVFDFTEYSSASDVDSLLITSKKMENNLKLKPIISKESSGKTDSNHKQNHSLHILATNDGNDIVNRQNLSRKDDIYRQMTNTLSNEILLQTKSLIERNGPLTNNSQISKISSKFLFDEEKYSNINFKSPPNINKNQLKEEFENTAKMFNLGLPPPIVVLSKKK